MSNAVTIEGRIATTYLKVGEQATVERTDRIDRLIERGYVRLVGDESLVGAVYPTPDEETEDDGPEDDEVQAPPQSATRAEWEEFLISQGIPWPDDATKADLIEAWNGAR